MMVEQMMGRRRKRSRRRMVIDCMTILQLFRLLASLPLLPSVRLVVSLMILIILPLWLIHKKTAQKAASARTRAHRKICADTLRVAGEHHRHTATTGPAKASNPGACEPSLLAPLDLQRFCAFKGARGKKEAPDSDPDHGYAPGILRGDSSGRCSCVGWFISGFRA